MTTQEFILMFPFKIIFMAKLKFVAMFPLLVIIFVIVHLV